MEKRDRITKMKLQNLRDEKERQERTHSTRSLSPAKSKKQEQQFIERQVNDVQQREAKKLAISKRMQSLEKKRLD
jgi:translation elongation factor P/translation initiation factor 5A